ncbi:hypothetical protein Tco_0174719 [Tanacetum coccineum]
MAHHLTARIVRDGEAAKKGDSGKKRKDDQQKYQGSGQVTAPSVPNATSQATLLRIALMEMRIKGGGHHALSAEA